MNHDVLIDEDLLKRTDETIINVVNLPDIYSVKFERYDWIERNLIGYGRYIILKNNNPYLTLNRNHPFPAKPAYFVKNNIEYLITSGNYMCVTIINLIDGAMKTYVNEEAYSTGSSFCPLTFEYTDEDSTLSIYGCIWGDLYETLIFKNFDPDSFEFDYNKADSHIVDWSELDGCDDD